MYKALCDSLNASTTLAVLCPLITITNTYLQDKQETVSNPDTYFSLGLVKEVSCWMTQMLEIFGLANPTPNDSHSPDAAAPSEDLDTSACKTG